jgi:cyclopropane-fatty-acyl-phospholipid synthase
MKQRLQKDGLSGDLPDEGFDLAETAKPPLLLRILLYMFRGLRLGKLEVVLPGGERRCFEGSEPGPSGALLIHDTAVARKVVAAGEVGFGESYLDGDWDSPDLAALLSVMAINEPHFLAYEKNFIGRFIGWIRHRLNANTRRGARDNIRHHYDLGNDFYALWLDRTMAYSCAIFPTPQTSLADAQENKFRLNYERLELNAEHHLLEIGSGWGGFAIYAAQHSGCRVTSITLSQEQLAEAQRRAQAAGVADRVRFELRDYRDVTESYDRVVSIEMYEAVGEEYWPAYFGAIARALKPGGRAAIQGITLTPEHWPAYRYRIDFVQKYIFPGGMLCPPDQFQDLARQAGLQPLDPKFFASHYAATLAQWHRNVNAVAERIVEKFDTRFLRMWRYYLAYCGAGFRVGSCDLMQITLAKA